LDLRPISIVVGSYFREPGQGPGERRTRTRVIAADPACRIGGDALGHVEVAAQPVTIARLTYQIARSIKRFAFPSSSSLAS